MATWTSRPIVVLREMGYRWPHANSLSPAAGSVAKGAHRNRRWHWHSRGGRPRSYRRVEVLLRGRLDRDRNCLSDLGLGKYRQNERNCNRSYCAATTSSSPTSRLIIVIASVETLGGGA